MRNGRPMQLASFCSTWLAFVAALAAHHALAAELVVHHDGVYSFAQTRAFRGSDAEDPQPKDEEDNPLCRMSPWLCKIKQAAERVMESTVETVKESMSTVGEVVGLEEPPKEAGKTQKNQTAEGEDELPLMNKVDMMRTELCWDREHLHEHEDCLKFLGIHCGTERTGKGICTKFKVYVHDDCLEGTHPKERDLLCKVAEWLHVREYLPAPMVAPGPAPVPSPFPALVPALVPGPAPSPGREPTKGGPPAPAPHPWPQASPLASARRPAPLPAPAGRAVSPLPAPALSPQAVPSEAQPAPVTAPAPATMWPPAPHPVAAVPAPAPGLVNPPGPSPVKVLPVAAVPAPAPTVVTSPLPSPEVSNASSPERSPAPAPIQVPAPHPAADSDGDGVSNAEDVWPMDPKESKDTDGDGTGDNADVDRDADGVPNVLDAFPNNKDEYKDSNKNGIGDNAERDRDNDGVPDKDDAFPDNPFEWKDTDGDGVGDNADQYPFNKDCYTNDKPCRSLYNKVRRPLPPHGYDEFSRGQPHVEHGNDTVTGDWRREWPTRDETHSESISRICKEHPQNSWCKEHAL